jgi:hypothetical protein
VSVFAAARGARAFVAPVAGAGVVVRSVISFTSSVTLGAPTRGGPQARPGESPEPRGIAPAW